MKYLSRQSDEELCALAAKGDSKAEECLVVRYSRMVRVCTRPFFLIGGDREDLIQEGLIGLLSAIRTFDSTRDVKFQRYAETCVTNRLRSVVRSAFSEKHEPLNQAVSLDRSDLSEIDPYPPEMTVEETPEDMLIGREERSIYADTLADGLSAFEGKVLRLYLGGLSYSQIAFFTGKQVKAIDNAIQRIRRKGAASLFSGDNSVS